MNAQFTSRGPSVLLLFLWVSCVFLPLRGACTMAAQRYTLGWPVSGMSLSLRLDDVGHFNLRPTSSLLLCVGLWGGVCCILYRVVKQLTAGDSLGPRLVRVTLFAMTFYVAGVSLVQWCSILFHGILAREGSSLSRYLILRSCLLWSVLALGLAATTALLGVLCYRSSPSASIRIIVMVLVMGGVIPFWHWYVSFGVAHVELAETVRVLIGGE